MSKIANIILNDDYPLTIVLNKNYKIIYDMKSRFEALRLSRFADINKFIKTVVL